MNSTTNTENLTMEQRTILAAKKILENSRGYEILDVINENELEPVANIVALDTNKNNIVFVYTNYSLTETDFDIIEKLPEKKDLEKTMCEWLIDSDLEDMQVRFDSITFRIIGDEKAFSRHHINATQHFTK